MNETQGGVVFARTAPTISDRTRPYWTSGKDGVLRISRCQDCGNYIHPPKPVCPRCQGDHVEFEQVSGEGTVDSFTINRYQWKAEKPPTSKNAILSHSN